MTYALHRQRLSLEVRNIKRRDAEHALQQEARISGIGSRQTPCRSSSNRSVRSTARRRGVIAAWGWGSTS
jgi:hypothetical protein